MKSHAASMIDRQQQVSRTEVKYLTIVRKRGDLLAVTFERAVPILNRSRLTVHIPHGVRLIEVQAFLERTRWGHHFDAWLVASGQRYVERGVMRP